MNDAITPFSCQVEEAALEDLRRRLARIRWPDGGTATDWSQGAPLPEMRALVEYWRESYDWRRVEAKLNSFSQFRTEIDGLGFHFLHVRSPHANALPILLTHGWPGSPVEFLKLIEPLTDPKAHGAEATDAFHVVIPSLPGYGFSDKPTKPGWNLDRIAEAWTELMARLGYDRYVAQGGDWGAIITTRMAQKRAAGLVGIHLNYPQVFPHPIPESGLSAEEQQAVDAWNAFQANEGGYAHLQSTRPQTLGYALADSPVGQAAWLFEKFHAWTDHPNDAVAALTPDEMLDEISLYWLTDTAASSARLYFENAGGRLESNHVELPVGCSIFPHEVPRAPRSWAEQCFPNLIHWRELDRGGHFAAFEQPALFTHELRDCFRTLR